MAKDSKDGNLFTIDHVNVRRVLRDTFTTLCVFVAVRWAMGEPLPTLAVVVKMLLALTAVIYIMEWLDDNSSDTVVGVARANTASQVLGMIG